MFPQTIPEQIYRSFYLENRKSFFYSYRNSSDDIKEKWGIKENKELQFYIKGHVNPYAIFKVAHILSNHEVIIHKFEDSECIQIHEVFENEEHFIHFYHLDMNFSVAMKIANKFYPDTYIEVTPCHFEDYSLVKMTMRADTVILMYKMVEACGGFIDFEFKSEKTHHEDNGLWKKEWNNKNSSADLFSKEKSKFFYELQPISYHEIMLMYPKNVNYNKPELKGFYQFTPDEIELIYLNFERAREEKEISSQLAYIESKQKEIDNQSQILEEVDFKF